MAELRISLKESIVEELKMRAEKREVSVEDYVAKALRYHLKQIRKIEAGMEEDHQNMLRIVGQAEEAQVFDPDSPER